MSRHKFANLGEIFQGDLSRKIKVGMSSPDFEPPPCNCRTGGNGACDHNNMGKNSTAVCKVNATTSERCTVHGKHTTKVQSHNAPTLQ